MSIAASVDVDDILNLARGEIGVTEQPHGSNRVKYWADLDGRLQGNAWCGAFVSWVYLRAGAKLPAIDKPYGFVFCPDAVAWAVFHGKAHMTPQPGDIALYGKNRYAVHTGIVEKVSGNGHDFTAIEGNTAVGNDTNGGSVMRRQRNTNWVVVFLRADRPSVITQPVLTPPPYVPGLATSIEVDDMKLEAQFFPFPLPPTPDGLGWVRIPLSWSKVVSLTPQGFNPEREGPWPLNGLSISEDDGPDGPGFWVNCRLIGYKANGSEDERVTPGMYVKWFEAA